MSLCPLRGRIRRGVLWSQVTRPLEHALLLEPPPPTLRTPPRRFRRLIPFPGGRHEALFQGAIPLAPQGGLQSSLPDGECGPEEKAPLSTDAPRVASCPLPARHPHPRRPNLLPWVLPGGLRKVWHFAVRCLFPLCSACVDTCTHDCSGGNSEEQRRATRVRSPAVGGSL